MSGSAAADRADLDRPRRPPPAPEPVRHHPLSDRRGPAPDPGRPCGPGRSMPARYDGAIDEPLTPGPDPDEGSSLVRGLDPGARGADGRRAAQQRRADRGLPAADRAPRSRSSTQSSRPTRTRSAIAARRDAQRQAGRARGPLHGIPVLVKDNIATRDAMETTAGSLALVGSRVPRDARRGRPAARCRRGDPGQGQPVRVGQLPRPRPARGQGCRSSPQRLERSGRVHPEPLRPRLGPVRLELGLGGRAGRQPVRLRRRHRDGRLDRLPVRAATASSASSQPSAWWPRTGSSRSRRARTRPDR